VSAVEGLFAGAQGPLRAVGGATTALSKHRAGPIHGAETGCLD
jgi:hypothetical protein